MFNDVRGKKLGLCSAFCILHSAFIIPLLLLNSGCEQGGAIAGVIAQAIPRHVDAAYKGMANQTVVVMVWMDRAMKNDYPDVQLDIAASLQGKLIKEAATNKPELLKGTEFPVLTSTVIRNQEDHPEWENQPITETAAQFDCTRVIYLEIKDFATHAGAPELFRGTLKGDLKVIEITKDGNKYKGKVAFTDTDIAVDFPKDSPNDGLPIGTEYSITSGTVDAFTTEVAKRFYPHDEDRN
jgi:hypothetical protein